jgi:hypothetical protein
MNIAKNMEAVFVAAIAVAAFTTYATADVAVPSKPVAPVVSSDGSDGRPKQKRHAWVRNQVKAWSSSSIQCVTGVSVPDCR